jgi:hypothetical protein
MVAAVCCAALFFPHAACSTCDRSDDRAIAYSQGQVVGDSYETNPPEGTWLHFPAGRRYLLRHGLGVTPEVVSYLAFSERPLPEAGADAGTVGNASVASGNQVIVEQQGPEIVQVRNDTCSEYWIRVVARRP